MNLLDRLLHHDRSTTRALLDLAHDLDDGALDREFDLGPRTLRATLEHIVRNVEVWTALMRSEPAPARDDAPAIETMAARFERAYDAFEQLAREIEARGTWDERWLDTLDDPPREKSYGGAIAHVITHSMHHRAQILFMLRRSGVENVPEGDALSCDPPPPPLPPPLA